MSGEWTRQLIRIAWLAALSAGLLGCSRQEAGTPTASTEIIPPLARVNDRAFTQEDVQFEMQRRLQSGRPVGDAESLVNELVEREVMLQAARKSEWMKDPIVQREMENQLLTRWLARTLQIKKNAVTVTDDDLREVYEERISDYTKPALFRLAILFRKTTPQTSAESLASLRAHLEDGRAAYLADPDTARQGGRMKGFGAIAADYSEETTSRYRGGDLGWIDPSRMRERWPAEVLDLGRSLEPDQPSEVLATDRGLFVVMKTDMRPSRTQTFEEVIAGLRRRLIRERQEEVEQTFLAALMQDSTIELDPEQIAQLTLPGPLNALAGESSPDRLDSATFPGARP